MPSFSPNMNHYQPEDSVSEYLYYSDQKIQFCSDNGFILAEILHTQK